MGNLSHVGGRFLVILLLSVCVHGRMQEWMEISAQDVRDCVPSIRSTVALRRHCLDSPQENFYRVRTGGRTVIKYVQSYDEESTGPLPLIVGTVLDKKDINGKITYLVELSADSGLQEILVYGGLPSSASDGIYCVKPSETAYHRSIHRMKSDDTVQEPRNLSQEKALVNSSEETKEDDEQERAFSFSNFDELGSVAAKDGDSDSLVSSISGTMDSGLPDGDENVGDTSDNTSSDGTVENTLVLDTSSPTLENMDRTEGKMDSTVQKMITQQAVVEAGDPENGGVALVVVGFSVMKKTRTKSPPEVYFSIHNQSGQRATLKKIDVMTGKTCADSGDLCTRHLTATEDCIMQHNVFDADSTSATKFYQGKTSCPKIVSDNNQVKITLVLAMEHGVKLRQILKLANLPQGHNWLANVYIWDASKLNEKKTVERLEPVTVVDPCNSVMGQDVCLGGVKGLSCHWCPTIVNGPNCRSVTDGLDEGIKGQCVTAPTGVAKPAAGPVGCLNGGLCGLMGDWVVDIKSWGGVFRYPQSESWSVDLGGEKPGAFGGGKRPFNFFADSSAPGEALFRKFLVDLNISPLRHRDSVVLSNNVVVYGINKGKRTKGALVATCGTDTAIIMPRIDAGETRATAHRVNMKEGTGDTITLTKGSGDYDFIVCPCCADDYETVAEN